MAREGRSNGSEDDDWSMPVSIVHILGRRALSSAASALTIRAQLVAQLEQNTFPRLQAERLVEVLDAAVCEAIQRESWKHMSLEEYEKILRTFQEGLEVHRKEMQQLEQNTAASQTADQEFILAEINRTRQQIKDEVQQLEASIKLDLNLERKRRSDLIADIEGKGRMVGEYLEQKEREIQDSLKTVARQAMTAIGSSAGIIIFGFLLYKAYSA